MFQSYIFYQIFVKNMIHHWATIKKRRFLLPKKSLSIRIGKYDTRISFHSNICHFVLQLSVRDNGQLFVLAHSFVLVSFSINYFTFWSHEIESYALCIATCVHIFSSVLFKNMIFNYFAQCINFIRCAAFCTPQTYYSHLGRCF